VLTAVCSSVRSTVPTNLRLLTSSVSPLSRELRGPVVITPLRRSSVFSCFEFEQSYHGYSMHCVIVWVCLCVMFVRMYRSTYDSVELSVGACVGHFTYQSINQSIRGILE